MEPARLDPVVKRAGLSQGILLMPGLTTRKGITGDSEQDESTTQLADDQQTAEVVKRGGVATRFQAAPPTGPPLSEELVTGIRGLDF
ncbi:hypothetical protein HOLleu_03913 [Holothuria leucospilota]|uniref:Uncharacterized protein n=1 Tax=Holothuria leucospilota TaxID=206669 RepID=A0A9Q1CS82_HOLLE|nr:hypothetical protein HOLleu_03913 [Holothuria leucospilota]